MGSSVRALAMATRSTERTGCCVFGCAFGLVVVGCVIRLFGFVGLVGYGLCALRAVFWGMV